MARAFGKIALALAGGGTRAVGFHLGSLLYLHMAEYVDSATGMKRRVLEDVSLLSAVSGGSLIGLGYAASLKRGTAFADFYRGMLEAIDLNRRLAQRLLELIGKESPPAPSGRRYLVSAYAALYQSFRCFGMERFGIFWDGAPMHLEEIVINATDFHHGTGFRFHYGPLSPQSGNPYLRIPEDVTKDLRLADIMAVSSDHPGILEPMLFPDDFHWPGDPRHYRDGPRGPRLKAVQDLIEAQIRARLKAVQDLIEAQSRPRVKTMHDLIEAQIPRSVTLMDGGIYDNQAVQSIIDWVEDESGDRTSRRGLFKRLIEPVPSKSAKAAPLDFGRPKSWWVRSREGDTLEEAESDEIGLVFVSDSPIRRYGQAIYRMPQEEERGNFSLQCILIIDLVFLSLSALSFLAIIGKILLDYSRVMSATVFELIVFGLPVVVHAVVFALVLYATRRLKKAVNTCRQSDRSLWPMIRALRVRDIRDMISLRVHSTFKTVEPIMTTRMRDLTYEMLKTHPRIHTETVVTNEMHDLIELDRLPPELPPWLRPSAAMQEVALRVAAMETELWVDPGRLRDLIACGQFTTCYNLLAQLLLNPKLYPRDGEVFRRAEHRQVYEKLFGEWKRMQDDPLCLLPANDHE